MRGCVAGFQGVLLLEGDSKSNLLDSDLCGRRLASSHAKVTCNNSLISLVSYGQGREWSTSQSFTIFSHSVTLSASWARRMPSRLWNSRRSRLSSLIASRSRRSRESPKADERTLETMRIKGNEGVTYPGPQFSASCGRRRSRQASPASLMVPSLYSLGRPCSRYSSCTQCLPQEYGRHPGCS